MFSTHLWPEDDDFSFSMHKLPFLYPLTQNSCLDFVIFGILVPLHLIILPNIRNYKDRGVLGCFFIVIWLDINTNTPSNILISHHFIVQSGAEHCREHQNFTGKVSAREMSFRVTKSEEICWFPTPSFQLFPSFPFLTPWSRCSHPPCLFPFNIQH